MEDIPFTRLRGTSSNSKMTFVEILTFLKIQIGSSVKTFIYSDLLEDVVI
jgi:hypothetical protein